MACPRPQDTDPVRLEGRFTLGGEELWVISTPLAPGRDVALSSAEGAVLTLLCDGLSYREIAARRGVSPSTISNQVQSLFRKLGVHSRRELVRADAPASARR